MGVFFLLISSLEELSKEVEKYKIISIIGLAKNVGKTTTLNHLLQESLQDQVIGVTSIGRDGEKYDVITELPKPRIYIKKGTFFATAKGSWERCEIESLLIKNTRISTPLGEINIYRALEDGHVELAGPSINSELSLVCSNLLKLGCKRVLIDGAFDRKSLACPLISNATILSTGASVSRNMEKVIENTNHLINLLSLELEHDLEIKALATKYIKSLKICMINSNKRIKILGFPTVLGHEKEATSFLDENSKFLVLNGALTDKLINQLMKNFSNNIGVTIIVDNATKLFITDSLFKEFIKKGGNIKVLQPINLVAVTINPTSPFGYNFDSKEFISLFKEQSDVPIFDLGPNNY